MDTLWSISLYKPLLLKCNSPSQAFKADEANQVGDTDSFRTPGMIHVLGINEFPLWHSIVHVTVTVHQLCQGYISADDIHVPTEYLTSCDYLCHSKVHVFLHFRPCHQSNITNDNERSEPKISFKIARSKVIVLINYYISSIYSD